MKYLKIILILISFCSQAIAQDNIDELVQEGVKYHDGGNYDKAIEIYKKALDIDTKSPLVNYEIAYSYFASKNYRKAIEHADIVIKQDTKLKIQAYLIKGSALDLLGKTQESIKMFKKAIKNNEPHHLLYYNLALNYFKIQEYDDAEESLVEAITTKPSHSTSHLLLAYVQSAKRKTVQTLLAVHYFLLLEPNSRRSPDAYKLLQGTFGSNVSKDKDKPNQININILSDKKNEFATAELMISLMEAGKTVEKNKDKTEDELFIEHTTSFFTVLGKPKKKNKGIWWEFYVPLFNKMSGTKHMEAYCHYISQSSSESSAKWLENNSDKVEALFEWLKK